MIQQPVERSVAVDDVSNVWLEMPSVGKTLPPEALPRNQQLLPKIYTLLGQSLRLN
jgi:hypothetical protein